ncbi:lysine--tRNA ligase [Lacipirellula parvula]|uniref:Lysine--tRNA ligase n=1 Tax=Lacipirellula parvula TaxID=2650471 RepID=A0A5K7XCV0_9BACT|nr:lysine--tRNA ligase [Lacipirellula parvula]BBO32153.1 lysyl-tRNA synthetase [Lacipirellula parvula]
MMPAPQSMTDQQTPADDATDPSRDQSFLEAARRAKLARIIELGHDPWGTRFDDRQLIGEIRARTNEILYRKADGANITLPSLETEEERAAFRPWLAEQGAGEIVGPQVRAAGRIILSRDKGKLLFIDIRDMTGQVQLFIGRDQVGDSWDLAQCFDLGDIIGVDGTLRRTKTGELSIFADRLHILTKSIETPPEKHSGLQDAELRTRQRYLDLTYNEGVLDRFLDRTRIVSSIRKTLGDRGFVEVEGPTLHTIAGGAAARPFTTHHNTLDLDLFMRIALELHLKRLLVGGVERVYELGRVYRNEGISPKHNPEFTMLEVYQAYGDYRSMMDLTEECICEAIHAINESRDSSRELRENAEGGNSVSRNSQLATRNYQLSWAGKTVDFKPPFKRATYAELFKQHAGVDPTDSAAVAALAKKLGIETAGRHPDVIKNDVFEEKVEDALEGPIFVIDYPASICPLTKRKASDPTVAERFELFIGGMEIANAYTELNDPDLQEELFRSQLAGMSEEDSMAKMDTDFIRALRHGMPPAGGLGIGIDRLVMLLTGTQSIRDVILFPVLRPEK